MSTPGNTPSDNAAAPHKAQPLPPGSGAHMRLGTGTGRGPEPAFAEFVALMAMMFSTIAFSIDAMLPALPRIGAELAPENAHHAQLVVTAFVLGMGLGTLVCGPLSDSLGRKPVMLWGMGLFVLAALAAAQAQSIDTLLAARFVQGLGAAAPRVVALAMVRDRYEGRRMAQVVSIVMTLFILVPAVAPAIGAGLIWLWDWRAIFHAFVGFGLITALWLGLRQPETLLPAARRPLRPGPLLAALREVLGNAAVRIYILVLSCAFGSMFTWLSSAPLIFDEVFDRAAGFPFWFALMALLAGLSNILNARLVMRLGMWRLATTAFAAQLAASALVLGLMSLDPPAPWDFALFIAYLGAVFFSLGLTFGNLNALALQPLGHIAGTGAAVVGAIYTTCAAFIAIIVSLAYDDSAYPAMIGTLLCTMASLALMYLARRSGGTGD